MIDKETVKKVAKNAKLKLSEKELDKFTKELKDTLEAFSKIEEVDTKGVKPSFHPFKLENRTREDEVKKGLSQGEALDNAKNKEEGYFKGPKVV